MRWRLTQLRRKRAEKRLEAELQSHIEWQVRDYVAAGMDPEQARRRALLEFGGVEQIKEQCRDVRAFQLIEGAAKDLRFALRTLRKNPTFTVVSVLTLALGMGAVTAIFTVVNGVILRPLPYPDPARLVTVWEASPIFASGQIRFSPGNYIDLRERNKTFSQVGGFTSGNYNLSGRGNAERVTAGLVSSSMFGVLGISPMLGRGFTQDDDAPGAPGTAILSYGLWRANFQADPGVLGESMRLDDVSYTIIGVMPPGLSSAPPGLGESGPEFDLWLPIERALGAETMGWPYSYYVGVIARLGPGTTVEQARADVEGILEQIRLEHPQAAGKGGLVQPLQERAVAGVRGPLFIFLGAVGFVLLIALANVANLSFAHTAARSREIAVRLALGASRARVLRQLLTQSILLSMIGAGLAFPAALLSVPALLKMAPDELPRQVHADLWIAGFALLLAIVSGVLCGLLPGLSASRADVQGELKQAGRSMSAGRRARRFRGALVGLEIAIALVLVAGAGLMIKSFERVLAVDPGFQPAGLITMRIALSEEAYDDSAKQTAFFDQLRERLRATAGVRSYGLIDGLPFSSGGFNNSFSIDGQPAPPPGEALNTNIRRVDAGYFATMGVPIIQGRELLDTDVRNAPEAVVISLSMARKYWPNESPIGKRLKIEFSNPYLRPEIVGVAGDVRSGLDQKPQDYVYLPYPQGRHVTNMYVILRPEPGSGSSASAALADAVRGAVASIDGNQPVYRVHTMEELLGLSVATRRFETLLLGVFAALAAFLAVVGVYGMVAYSVQLRTREIGIRTALGARAIDVLVLLLKNALTVGAAGVLVGILGGLALTRVLQGLLFEVEAADPQTFLIAAGALLAAVLGAAYVASRKAVRLDPLRALRHD